MSSPFFGLRSQLNEHVEQAAVFSKCSLRSTNSSLSATTPKSTQPVKAAQQTPSAPRQKEGRSWPTLAQFGHSQDASHQGTGNRCTNAQESELPGDATAPT